MTDYDARKDGIGSYYDAIAAKRAKMLHEQCPAAKRVEVIGDCVLYQGDCLEVMSSLSKVGLVVTDPPYAISVSGSAQVRKDGTRRLDFFVGDDDWAAMTEKVVLAWQAALRLLHADGSAYCYCGHRQFGSLVGVAEAEGFETRFVVWRKACPPPAMKGNGWRAGAELCVYAYRSGRKFRAEQAVNVITADTFRHGQPGKVDHPTQKPIQTIMPLIEASSDRGDTVLDPYMGSGTTGVSCVKSGRSFIGIEIDEGYFNIACERIRKAYAQPDMFIEAAKPKAEQLSMLGEVAE